MKALAMRSTLLLCLMGAPWACAVAAGGGGARSVTPGATPMANEVDRQLAGVFEAREADWRNGAVVYQVLVDRFAPSERLAEKRHLYPEPKVLRGWHEQPARGQYLPTHKLWSHEIDFWGGDLASLTGKLPYIKGLGVDVLYLNPVHLAYTNHKYDALDYQQISPEFGTRSDVKRLAQQLHGQGLKLVLDGVFNHMGRNSAAFQSAEASVNSPYRDWFVFGPEFPGGARAWWQAENLPELNLENPKVRAHIYGDPDSVVRSYLRDGVDGWRLDVAFDIGFAYLGELTRAAHAQKPGSLVVGEIANYPSQWFPAVDGVMHFTLRHILLGLASGRFSPAVGQGMINRMIDDAGVENMLKSWIYLDNHDTARLATTLPAEADRRLAQVMQFTLPGAPNLYYGSELGMKGGDDPEMRGPMPWDQVSEQHPELAWTKRLIQLHQTHRALRVGNYRTLQGSGKLVAYQRYTDRAGDSVFVLLNPTTEPVTDVLMLPDAKVMDGTRLLDLLSTSDGQPAATVRSALLQVTLPAKGMMVLKPDLTPQGGYTNYKRVQ